ncbi:MAG: tetratricopeptide repeat protein [Sandaracinaceae bacterium]
MIAPLLKATWVLIAMALVVAPARAQETSPGEAAEEDGDRGVGDEERARGLFEDGVAAGDEGDWATAVARFRASLALRASPVVAYNLASALVRVGRPEQARLQLDALLADSETDARVRQSARTLLEEVEAQLGRVRLEVESQPPLQISVDGEPVDARPAVELHLAPGTHAIEVSADDGTSLSLHTEIRSGAREVLRLPAPTAPVDETALHWGIGLGVAGGALVASLAFVIGMLAAGL